MMEAGLNARLLADAGVSAIVAARIYPVNLPEEIAGDAVTYRVISNLPDYTMDGHTGMQLARVEIIAWSEVYGNAKQLAAAIQASLEDFTGTLPDGTVVENVWLANAATDGFDADARLYRVQTDYRLIYDSGPPLAQ